MLLPLQVGDTDEHTMFANDRLQWFKTLAQTCCWIRWGVLQYSSDIGSALVQAGGAAHAFWAQACRGWFHAL